MQLSLKPAGLAEAVVRDIVPVFIIGMPRTGTTLVAELLPRHPEVCNRDELNWISFLAEQLAIAQGFHDVNALRQAAALYLQQLRQDVAPTRYYIDKSPLNFRHLGLIAALFPNAKIIHCCHVTRDTALSIWTQLFDHPENAYAHRFDNIAALMQGHDRLLHGLVPKLRLALHRVRYEDPVTQPDAVLAGLAAFTGLGAETRLMSFPAKAGRPIGTARVWQARQPIHARGVGRWQQYLPYLPELATLGTADDALSDSPIIFHPVQQA